MKYSFQNRSGTLRPVGNKPRRGMTLVEVVVAMALLSGSLLAMGAYVARYAQVTGATTIRAEANELVAERLEEVKGALQYSTIESVFAKTETSIPNHPLFQRRTLITRTGGTAPALYDYKTVTVIVTAPALKNPAKKSTVISVF
jgi:prepilin-type N-terminal cleavage/methylation domain-containing protein